MQKIHMKQNINKRESTGLKDFKDSKAFTEYSNDMQDTYKNIGEYNLQSWSYYFGT